MNIILTTEPESHNRKHHKTVIVKNIKLYRHPNPNAKMKEAYIFNHSPYFDQIDSFDKKTLKWSWDINDKRKVKRMKKYKKYNKKIGDELQLTSGISNRWTYFIKCIEKSKK